MSGENFIQHKGNYRGLRVYQIAECIYDITYYFANANFRRGDRTIDQMVQAARSGKQNIAEGSAAGVTSAQTEIKLMNVARASMQELLIDYEDYLRVHNLELWANGSDKQRQTAAFAQKHTNSAFYREAVKTRTPETTANIAITLIHQFDVLMLRLLDTAASRFVREGGFREQMTKARLDYRNNPQKAPQSSPKTPSSQRTLKNNDTAKNNNNKKP